MKYGIVFVITTLIILLLPACGDSTGPSQVDLTPSVLSLVFTGDSSKIISERSDLMEIKGACEVTVTWTICPESLFDSYVLYRSEGSGISADPSIAQVLGVFSDANINQYIDTNVQWATEYYYVLRTQDEDDNGVWSNEASIITPGNLPTPSVLSADLNQGDVLLDWTVCPDSNFYSYRLYRSLDPNIQSDTTFAENIYTATGSSDTLFTDSDVISGSDYYYALLTTNTSGYSSWSNEETVSVAGDLPSVQNLALDASSTGRTVNLIWDPLLCDVDGYQVYFKADATGSWVAIGESPTANFTHIATNAGSYAVKGYKGSNYSEGYSNEVNTMPAVITVTYTIYDNYSPADRHSAFIFGETGGITGMAPDASFAQDIYAYDDSKGDNDVSLYSGNFGLFGNGNQSFFQTPSSGEYGNCDPDGSWVGSSYQLYTSDSVVFIKLPYVASNAYAKIFGLSITPDPTTNHGTMISFSYEYQTNELGLTLFTSNW